MKSTFCEHRMFNFTSCSWMFDSRTCNLNRMPRAICTFVKFGRASEQWKTSKNHRKSRAKRDLYIGAGQIRLRSIYRSFSPLINPVYEVPLILAELCWPHKGFFLVLARGNPKVVRMGLVIFPSVFDGFEKSCKKHRACRSKSTFATSKTQKSNPQISPAGATLRFPREFT